MRLTYGKTRPQPPGFEPVRGPMSQTDSIAIAKAAPPAALARMLTRRSVPVLAMQGPGPDADQLEHILKAASRVPDHGKLAPWRLIVFEGEARARAGEIFAQEFVCKNPAAEAQQLEIERKRFTHAPLVIGVVSVIKDHPKIPEWEMILSAGAVCMNIIWAANALGFVSSWLTQWCAYDRDVLTRLGIGEGERIAGFIHIGSREGAMEDRPRPALADVVTRF